VIALSAPSVPDRDLKSHDARIYRPLRLLPMLRSMIDLESGLVGPPTSPRGGAS
jgi:hypothetical protein